MCRLPDFLPPIFDLNHLSWPEMLDISYQRFLEDFVRNRMYYNGMQIKFDERKIDQDKEEGFWHLTSKKQNGERLQDIERMARIPWIKAIINNHNNSSVLHWDHLDSKNNIRKYLWLQDQNHVVILKKPKKVNILVLITAFCVDSGYFHSLNRKYNRREANTL